MTPFIRLTVISALCISLGRLHKGRCAARAIGQSDGLLFARKTQQGKAAGQVLVEIEPKASK